MPTNRLNVLATGGAGFIGSHACKRLAQYGYQPVVPDNLSLDHKAAAYHSIYSLSASVYGLPENMPITEDFPLRPMNPYGSNKAAVERMLAEVGATNGMPWVALRYFNAGGADPDGEIGENHDPETHLIPAEIRSALTNTSVSIFADDYDTPDGTCIRDYVRVMDIAAAHVLALQYTIGGGASGAFNLANARGYSVKEVIAAVSACTAVQSR